MGLLSPIVSPNLASLALSIAILLSTYITSLCLTPPNPRPTDSKATDRIGFLITPILLSTGRAIVFLLGIYHALTCLTYPATPLTLCPQPSNISPHLFTWNTHTIICILLILIASPIRLLCFAQLGPNFTFQLTAPRKLVTTGLYKYVQHPSYAAIFIVMLANAAMVERLDGVAACWLSKSVVDSERFGMALRIGTLVIGVIVCWGMTLRVRDEEDMLRRAFGKEWEVYHAKTKRYTPGMF